MHLYIVDNIISVIPNKLTLLNIIGEAQFALLGDHYEVLAFVSLRSGLMSSLFKILSYIQEIMQEFSRFK